MNTYTIYPLVLGNMLLDHSSVCFARNPGNKVACTMYAFLILGGTDGPILVDTGCCGEEWAEKYHMPVKIGEDMTLEKQLLKHGLTPKNIDIVINTHLHWDHCFQNHLFGHARIYVQKRELEFAINPLPTQYRAYECPQMGAGLVQPWASTRDSFVVIEGDHHLCDGIDLLFLPGHTPGSQGVLVNTEKDKYLIAGDAIQANDAMENRTFGLIHPSGVHVDLWEYYETLKRFDTIDAHILPGHELTIAHHEVYPN